MVPQALRRQQPSGDLRPAQRVLWPVTRRVRRIDRAQHWVKPGRMAHRYTHCWAKRPNHPCANAAPSHSFRAPCATTEVSGTSTTTIVVNPAVVTPVLLSSAINLSATLQRSRVSASGDVVVRNGSGAALSGAVVTATWTAAWRRDGDADRSIRFDRCCQVQHYLQPRYLYAACQQHQQDGLQFRQRPRCLEQQYCEVILCNARAGPVRAAPFPLRTTVDEEARHGNVGATRWT